MFSTSALQIFLNMRRRSTYGLANMMVTITAIGKTTDFMQNYILIMPIQYVIMAYFSSTVAQIQTLQVRPFRWEIQNIVTMQILRFCGIGRSYPCMKNVMPQQLEQFRPSVMFYEPSESWHFRWNSLYLRLP